MTTGKKKPNNVKTDKASEKNQVPDLGNHPYFVEKAAKSRASLLKSGFPKELVVKK